MWFPREIGHVWRREVGFASSSSQAGEVELDSPAQMRELVKFDLIRQLRCASWRILLFLHLQIIFPSTINTFYKFLVI